MRLLRTSLLLAALLIALPLTALPLPSGLVVLSPNHPPSNVSTHDFGAVDPLQIKTLRCTFRLHNNATVPITIEQIQPSCGCTSTLLSPTSESKGKATIAPNQTVILSANIQVDHLNPGDFIKYIYVFIEDDLAPTVTLEMKGKVLPLAEFDPPVVDFGTVAFGCSHTQVLKIRIDDRLLKRSRQPLLLRTKLSSSPTPSDRQPSLSFIKTALISNPHPIKWHDHTAMETSYQVTLEPYAPLGPLQAILYGAIPSLSNTLACNTVTLKANVIGSFQCEPRVIVLGSVFQGLTAYDQTILKTTRPDLWQGLTIRTSAPYLKAWLVPLPTSAASSPLPSTRTLQVQLTSKAPAGALTLYVFVYATDREQMDIPVYVNVTPRRRN
ncbi:MAG TPA: DUF1573 domain-containing protein [Chthonomonas sp.]|uniref:DUF1573 domain-containing protein n=1 Tax=Chthonomonas sp. TaxID=2282153 RepID=UPI002B4AB580|nr:DUF1573 domain-containing protein [Chthonomonas sp.]HLH80301.1 DUF1573 domain-containing protein [Chthonomonas sp.]